MSSNCEHAVGELLTQLQRQTVRFCSMQLGMAADGPIGNAGSLRPALMSALPVNGTVQGTIYLCAEEQTVADIVRRLIGEDSVALAEPGLLEDTLNELLNVVVGNATRDLDEIGLHICVSPPSSVSRHGSAGPPAATEGSRQVRTDSGMIVLSFETGAPVETARQVA